MARNREERMQEAVEGMQEIGRAIGNMYKPLPTGEAAIQAGREVMEKIRKEIEERTGERPWDKARG